MTPQTRELYRRNLLLQLNASRLYTSPAVLLNGLEIAGFERDEKVAIRELEYLTMKAFVVAQRSEISAGVLRYKITSVGIDYLESI